MKRLLPFLSALVLTCSAFADDGNFATVDYSFTGDADYSFSGPGRPGQQDVAMLINDPTLVGARIVGVRIPLGPNRGLLAEDCSVWGASELTLSEDGENVADIFSVETKIIGAPVLRSSETPEVPPSISVDFSSPIIIPIGGLYLGYSLTVTQLYQYSLKFPHAVAPTDKSNGFFLHAPALSQYVEWTPYGVQNGVGLAMTIIIEIPQDENAATIALTSDAYSLPGTPTTVDALITNHGTSEVSSLEYIVDFEDGEHVGPLSYSLDDNHISSAYASEALVKLPIPARNDMGEHLFTVTLTGINSKPNTDMFTTASAFLNVIDFMPVTRPLMEEYTGFWCAACPSAYVTLLQMHDYDPDLIAISIHNKDKIATVTPDKYPFHISGYPSIHVNRKTTRGASMSLTEVWDYERAQLAPAAIEVNAEWCDDEQTHIKATATARFIDPHSEADYRIAFCLIGNGLTSPDWGQRNDYAGNTNLTGPYWDIFTNADREVKGLVYDDVALIYPSLQGEAGSIPSEIERGKFYSASYEFDLADATCNDTTNSNYGVNLVQDKSKLRVIAMVYDAKTAKVVNSTITDFMQTSGVETVGEENHVVATEYYDLQGIKYSERPSSGLYILVERRADGSTTARKLH
ncbi:MAG: hypothetical protein NC036_06510 [Muribaculaceae bacterium]|nr:hypothetical protein [Muribaculaceae bacterium]